MTIIITIMNNNNNNNDISNLLLLVILRLPLLFYPSPPPASQLPGLSLHHLQAVNAYIASPFRLIRIYVEFCTLNKTSLTFILRSEVFTHSNEKRNVVVFIYTSNKPSAIIHKAKENSKFVLSTALRHIGEMCVT